MSVIKINDKEYKFEDLSNLAKGNINSIAKVDQEINRLKDQQAMLQTARNAYIQSLMTQLPETTRKRKDIITIDAKKYALEDFSDKGKADIESITVCNQKLEDINSSIAIAQTSRNAYAQVLASQLNS